MRILAYRFSAFGDVASLAPIFYETLEQNPDAEIHFYSRKNFADLFHHIPNFYFYGVDLREYSGILGLKKLSQEMLTQSRAEKVANLHNVLRTNILDGFLRKKGLPVKVLDKGRREKRILTNPKILPKPILKPVSERYADVLRDLGLSVSLSHQLPVNKKIKKGIGFAPFAQHRGKILPLHRSFELAKKIAKNSQLFLFGGGEREIEILEQWENKLPNTQSVAGKLSLKEELELISTLQVMVSMDSANMHLASLVGTRCISIWGATHPFAGFLGYGQKYSDVVQIEDLTCRPCSVFGNKTCFRGDWACLNEINIDEVIEKLYFH